MKIKIKDATGQQIKEAFKTICTENVRQGVCIPEGCLLAPICGENPDDWDLDLEIEVEDDNENM